MYIDEIDLVTLNHKYDKDGNKEKKQEVDAHFNSQGMTLKKLVPLLESYNESLQHFDHKIKLVVEFIEVDND